MRFRSLTLCAWLLVLDGGAVVAAGMAGHPQRAVDIATVGNLLRSNAPPGKFAKLSASSQHRAAQDAVLVEGS